MNSAFGWAEQGINHLSGNRRGARAKDLSSVLSGREKWGGVAASAVPGPATRIASHHFAAVNGLRFMRGGEGKVGRVDKVDKGQRETRVGSAHRLRSRCVLQWLVLYRYSTDSIAWMLLTRLHLPEKQTHLQTTYPKTGGRFECV